MMSVHAIPGGPHDDSIALARIAAINDAARSPFRSRFDPLSVVQAAGYTELESTITFGYELALKLSAVGDWFAPTTGETDANLRFRYTFEGRVALPLEY